MRLERVNDAAEGGTLVIPVSISIPAHNARAMLVTPAVTLPPGQYQVVLNMDLTAAIRSQSGAPLDAEAAGIGERLVTRFSVAADSKD